MTIQISVWFVQHDTFHVPYNTYGGDRSPSLLSRKRSIVPIGILTHRAIRQDSFRYVLWLRIHLCSERIKLLLHSCKLSTCFSPRLCCLLSFVGITSLIWIATGLWSRFVSMLLSLLAQRLFLLHCELLVFLQRVVLVLHFTFIAGFSWPAQSSRCD